MSTQDGLSTLIGRIDAAFSGTLGACAVDLTTNRRLDLRADRSFPTASTIKVAVMAEAFAQAEASQISLSERVALSANQQVPGTGVLADLAPGLMPTIEDLVTLMVVASDNTATNMLIEILGGVEAVNNGVLPRNGIHGLILHRPICFAEIGDDSRRFAEATPCGFVDLLTAIVRGQLVGPRADRRMLQIMRRQPALDQAPRYLDLHRDRAVIGLNDDVQVACKTGVFPRVRVDVGAVTGPDGAIVYAFMNEGSSNRDSGAEHDGMVTNGRLGRALFTGWWPLLADRGHAIDSRYLEGFA